jgi:hypothetical protein
VQQIERKQMRKDLGATCRVSIDGGSTRAVKAILRTICPEGVRKGPSTCQLDLGSWVGYVPTRSLSQ